MVGEAIAPIRSGMDDNSNKTALLGSTMASAHLSTRREPRYQLHFEIEVCGIGPSGQPFRLRTSTLDVSEWGCRFVLPSRMENNAVITVQTVKDENGQAVTCPVVMFQVVRVLEFVRRFEVAAWKLAPENVWPTKLPSAPPDKRDGSAEKMRKDPLDPQSCEPNDDGRQRS